MKVKMTTHFNTIILTDSKHTNKKLVLANIITKIYNKLNNILIILNLFSYRQHWNSSEEKKSTQHFQPLTAPSYSPEYSHRMIWKEFEESATEK